MIYSRDKGLKYHPLNTPAVDLSPDKRAELLTEPACTVVPRHQTWAKIMVMADNMPSNDLKALGRRMRISRGLPVSLKLAILTEALSYRYCLQDSLMENSFEDWADAFNVKGPSVRITMQPDHPASATGCHKPPAGAGSFPIRRKLCSWAFGIAVTAPW